MHLLGIGVGLLGIGVGSAMFKRTYSAYFIGIAAAIGASVFFSVNDMAIKFLSGDYALYQIVTIRSIIGLFVLLAIVIPFEGKYASLKTKRLALHLFRGLCVVVANMTFFMALAAMPLAETVAIFFVTPLIITVFSVVFLGESVGVHRWMAVVVGFIGVGFIMRPGSDSFQLGALLPLISATAYASLHMLTRKLRDTEKAGTMAFYIQIVFIGVGILVGLFTGEGQFAITSHPSLEFLTRPWVWPNPDDYGLFALLGFVIAMAGFLISKAYSLCEAALVAPFEYVALILAIVWGFVIFGEWPDFWAWIGIILIVGGGMFMIWRENLHRNQTNKSTLKSRQ